MLSGQPVSGEGDGLPSEASLAPSGASRGATPSGYVPALDGVRAIAVLAVLAYHGGVSWLRGGFLGVDMFFVLSGYLITSLLVQERLTTGSVALREFWGRRARRLLPALLAVVLAVSCAAALATPGTFPSLRGDALSALFYVANWHFIASGGSYFHQSALPSPLLHTWSLAIEEQFYACWPLLLVGVWKLVDRRRRGARAALGWLAALAGVGAAASALEMALLHGGGASATRLYYGTDTHAQSVLVGALLALVLAWRAERRRDERSGKRPAPAARPGAVLGSRVAAAAGLAGLAATGVLWSLLSDRSPFLFEGGFLVAAVATGAVVLAVHVAPGALAARALSLPPLRWLGRISYGVYLWHYPLFVWLDGTRTGLSGPRLLGVRCAATLGVATVSYLALEAPIRRRRWFARRRALVAAPAAAAATALVAVLATLPAVPAAPASAGSVAVAGRHRVRVLVVGDSTALTLGMALSADAAAYGVTERTEAILGCGVTSGRRVEETGTVDVVARPCDTAPVPPATPLVASVPTPFGVSVLVPDAEHWTRWDRYWIERFHPAVVVVLAGRWEVMTRTWDGAWTNILHRRFAAYVERELVRIVHLAAAAGAHVVLMTAPCYDPGEQPDGRPWPTASGARVAAYDRAVTGAARAEPQVTTVFGLGALVCPHGVFRTSLDGVQLRDPDGVHFALGSGRVLGARIWPAVLKAATRS